MHDGQTHTFLRPVQVASALLGGSLQEDEDALRRGSLGNGADPGTVAAVTSSLVYLRDRVRQGMPDVDHSDILDECTRLRGSIQATDSRIFAFIICLFSCDCILDLMK